MPTKMEQLQEIWRKYDAEREHKPTSAREAVEWAVSEGLLELPKVDAYDVLAGQMSLDVDVYNDLNRGKNPEIQLVLDYTDDVAERQEMMKVQPKKVTLMPNPSSSIVS